MSEAVEDKVHAMFGEHIAPNTMLRLSHEGLIEKDVGTGFVPDEAMNDAFQKYLVKRLRTNDEHVWDVVLKEGGRFLQAYHELPGAPKAQTMDASAPASEWATHFDHFCEHFIPKPEAGALDARDKENMVMMGMGIASGLVVGIGGTMLVSELNKPTPDPNRISVDIRDTQSFIYPKELNDLSGEQLRDPQMVTKRLGLPESSNYLYTIYYPRGILNVTRDAEYMEAGAKCIELCKRASHAARTGRDTLSP